MSSAQLAILEIEKRLLSLLARVEILEEAFRSQQVALAALLEALAPEDEAETGH